MTTGQELFADMVRHKMKKEDQTERISTLEARVKEQQHNLDQASSLAHDDACRIEELEAESAEALSWVHRMNGYCSFTKDERPKFDKFLAKHQQEKP